MKNNYSQKILKEIFDENMIQNINTFAAEISDSDADIFIVMARKAACFIRFLQRCGLIDLAGIVVTDRVLDIDCSWINGKKVAIIDDVIVSGTTIYNVIECIREYQPSDIRVYVLGITETSCNKSIFDYENSNGKKSNYIQSPYITMTEAGCISTCSKIVSTFSLDISPYDVDFPRHQFVELSENAFKKIFALPDWKTYDVSSALQSKYGIYNITLIPEKGSLQDFDSLVGIPASKMGFYKIRVFARKENNKEKPYSVYFVPYYLFDVISNNDVNMLFGFYFGNDIEMKLQTEAKIRLLQYVFAEKLFLVWSNGISEILNKKIECYIDKTTFGWIFPQKFYNPVEEAVNKIITVVNYKPTTYNVRFKEFKSLIPVTTENVDDKAIIQSKLTEPFTALYHEDEQNARSIVKKYGVKAFKLPQYKEVIDRLKRGYSYQELIGLLSDFPDIFDKNTMVSLFLDEAIDAGIVVPIIAKEIIRDNGVVQDVYYRAYRHGEDVPFGEEQEKMCAILLKNYYEHGGKEILGKTRVEKLLVLFINIGLSQNLFKVVPEHEVLYKVNIASYLHGNVTIADHPTTKRVRKFLTHRADAVWLVDKLIAKDILIKGDSGSYSEVKDNIDLPIDSQVEGKISVIGDTFGMLYCNKIKNMQPSIEDEDLILLSTCLYPKDIINALATELAIFCERWRILSETNIPIENIVKKYKKDSLYISVNSGKMKYFSFIDKKALQKIDEITFQLAQNCDTKIYANTWKQFWPEDKDWNDANIGESTKMLINREGQCLIWCNILLRLLFASCSTSKRSRNEWMTEAKQLCDTSGLRYSEFSSDRFSKNIEDKTNSMIAELNAEEDIQKNYSEIKKAINWSIQCKVKPILSDVELYIDKHGKPVKVEHYGNIIFVCLEDDKYIKFENELYSFLNKTEIGFKIIRQDEDGELKRGLWILLRFNSKKFINNIIEHIFTMFVRIKYVALFLNLSDSLRIRATEYTNSNYKYANFTEYSNEVIAFIDKIYDETYNGAKIIMINEAGTGSKNRTFVKDYLGFERIKMKKIKSNVLFYDEIFIGFYKKKVEGRQDMLFEWYKKKEPMTVFVSYAETNEEDLNKIRIIVDRLKRSNIKVLFYEDQPLGTDMIEFMRCIKTSNFTLIIGSEAYKKKAEDPSEKHSGVSFEDMTIADMFQSIDRSHIIPLTFSDMNKTIPVPYNKLKGIVLQNVSEQALTLLVEGLIDAYKHQLQNS